MSISKKLFLGISAFILIFVILSYSGFVLFMPGVVESFKQDEMKAIANRIKSADNESVVQTLISDQSASSDISIVIEATGLGMYGSDTRGRGQGRNGDGLGSMLKNTESTSGISFYYAEHHVLNTPFMIYKDATNPDYIVYVMRPAQSINEVVMVAGQFFRNIAIIAILSGLVFSYIYSRRFVNPILNLNKIAKHMAKLDFTHSYNEFGEDEIGELGRSINHLSDQLSCALRDLKNELEHSEHLNTQQRRFLADASHELKNPP